MADRLGPARRDAIAGLGRSEGAVHQRAVMAQEPPQLPRLEDRRRGRRRGASGGEQVATDHQRRKHRRRAQHGTREAAQPQLGREREQHRAYCQQRPLLVGDRQPEQHARRQRAGAARSRPGRLLGVRLGGVGLLGVGLGCGRKQHGGHAQRRSQQFLGVSQFERAQRHWVGHAHAHRDRARQGAVAVGAHARHQPHAQRGRGEQAGQREHAIDRQFPPAPQPGSQRKGGALDQRAAVHGRQAQEFRHVSAYERGDRRLGLVGVVVPGKAV